MVIVIELKVKLKSYILPVKIAINPSKNSLNFYLLFNGGVLLSARARPRDNYFQFLKLRSTGKLNCTVGPAPGSALRAALRAELAS